MLVALNSNWKVPIGYFLLNRLSGAKKSNLIRTALTIIHDTGVLVKTLTFNGASNNISVATTLGAKLYPPDFKTYILHPITKEKICIFFGCMPYA